MKMLAELQEGAVVYDLGSGLGDVLFSIEDKKGKQKGYEIVFPVYAISCLRKYYKKSSALFVFGDFFKADLSDADVLFCYLVPSLMVRFEKEVWPQLRPGTRVVSHAFSLPKRSPQKTVYEKKVPIYLYVKEPERAFSIKK